jgi:hypothetical protein
MKAIYLVAAFSVLWLTMFRAVTGRAGEGPVARARRAVGVDAVFLARLDQRVGVLYGRLAAQRTAGPKDEVAVRRYDGDRFLAGTRSIVFMYSFLFLTLMTRQGSAPPAGP